MEIKWAWMFWVLEIDLRFADDFMSSDRVWVRVVIEAWEREREDWVCFWSVNGVSLRWGRMREVDFRR